MDPFERFDESARKVLAIAQAEAERSRHNHIGTEHLLLGIVRSDSEAARLLCRLGVEEQAVRDQIDKLLGGGRPGSIEQLVPTNSVKRVIEIAFRTASNDNSGSVAPEHILVGLLGARDGVAAHVLEDMGATLDAVREDSRRRAG